MKLILLFLVLPFLFIPVFAESTAFVLPTFTMAAYDYTYYEFFKKYGKVFDTVTTDLNLLTSQIPSEENPIFDKKAKGLEHMAKLVSNISDISFITDQDIHNGLINYSKMVLGHQEYVTQKEYDNFKKFVSNGGTLILLDANTFYTEVKYNETTDEVTLVKGHGWGFDGEKAWRDVKERWAEENTEFIGSNFACGSSCSIEFKNNPFNYTHHEEQFITNPDVKILLDYEATYNHKIAVYELEYGKGKVISFGIFGDDVIHNENFQKYFYDIFRKS